MSERFPQEQLTANARFHDIVDNHFERAFFWTRSCMLYQIGLDESQGHLKQAERGLKDRESVIRETAVWCLGQLKPPGVRRRISGFLDDRSEQVSALARSIHASLPAPNPTRPGYGIITGMLLTIEKVLIIKSVPIFSSVPEGQLVDLATIAESVEYEAGETIMNQGDLGTSMYIVVDGQVRIFEGEKELAVHGTRAVFGELAALDPEPRAASVQAIEDCTLLRLDGESLYDLMSGNKGVTRGIVHVLCDYTRQNLARSDK